MSERKKLCHRSDGSFIASQAWSAFFAQQHARIILDSPVNKAIVEIYESLDETDQDIMKRFYMSDHQSPMRFQSLTGIPVEVLMPILRRNQAELLRRLGFPKANY